MGVREYYQQQRRPRLGQDSNALYMLIIINVVIFVLLNLVKIIYLLSDSNEAVFNNDVLNWFTLPARGEVYSGRPWTLLTYMIAHSSVWGLISSMIWLWGFGYILQDLSGNRQIIPIYIYGGFIGGIIFLLSVNAIPAVSKNINSIYPMQGAGAAVMAIAVATTALSPNYRIFPMLNGGIPLWVITAIFVLIDYASVGAAGTGYALAHLAGAGVGFFYVWQLRKGTDLGEWMVNFYYWIDDLFNPEKKQSGSSDKARLYYKAGKAPFTKTPNVTQQRVDELLDKINQQGYHFLTDEEKDFLKKASREEL